MMKENHEHECHCGHHHHDDEGCHCEQEYGHDCCHDDECDCEACEDTPADNEDREHLHQPSKYDAALAKYETHLDDDAVTQAVDAIIESKVAGNDNEDVKKLLFSCLDLTSLRTADNDESILRLVERVNAFDDAHPDLPHVAAICTYPNFSHLVSQSLEAEGVVDKDLYIICNGFKKPAYIENIASFANNGWHNIIPILDNMHELDNLDAQVREPINIGIRIASEEEPNFEFYTSRLGIRYSDIVPFYENIISKSSKFHLKMLHFFINTGIRDTAYYWNELAKCVNVYCDLKLICPELDSLNIGGGFPIKNSLAMDFDYEYMAEEILLQIKTMCNARGVPEPNIFTEFGSFTVGESGATIFQVLDMKQQNDRERWYMIDSSFMTTLPDTWGIKQRFILLPINKWNEKYQRVFLGGLTCDSQDYYNADSHANAIFLPIMEDRNDPLYIGFFHTGAYQESISGFGGLQHCLQPAPKYIIIDRDENGEYFTKLFTKEQTYKSMLKILGY